MAKRDDLKKIVIFGSGPIVIGQACEFDYSGTQACKALMKEGYEVILINSNPATIMTDPEIATRVYIEPLSLDYVVKILEKEKPDAIIPNLGGQTALNLGLNLHKAGVLERLGIEMLGVKPEVIERAEDRERFRTLLDEVGSIYAKSFLIRNFAEGMEASEKLNFPIILRPNYTLGGGGGGVAYSQEEYQWLLTQALQASPTSEVLVEESLTGWKEFELEVMRDGAGTAVIVCSIENLDPCGVHTGDSITVAPQQTLSDRAYQEMRDETLKIIEAVGLETGGANIQFAVDPDTGKRCVIEVNPRVSRSSALASKATGFPIAKIAALLAVGYRLDEILNDITLSTPCCYEPALDYVVVKIPKFNFEKFEGSEDHLTTQMKSVGEVMALGRTFVEALSKALCSLEQGADWQEVSLKIKNLSYPNSQRLPALLQAFRDGLSLQEIARLTQIDRWFLEQIQKIWEMEQRVRRAKSMDAALLLDAKRHGLSDAHLGFLRGRSERQIRQLRWELGVRPGFFQVDTCAAEFRSETPYFYSTYWASPAPSSASGKLPVVVLGSGPNRIGQGIEFDYCCVRGVQKLRSLGHHVVMVNCNPETVSTDYDTADELYFEPLTEESLLEILHRVQPLGFVAQLGGQTPINLAAGLVEAGFNLLGSSIESIDLAEDRRQFSKICQKLNFKIPKATVATELTEALREGAQIGFPLICRPSYVLGGRRMQVIESEAELREYFVRYQMYFTKERPCLMDQFLEGALEVDVDLVRGKDWQVIGGILEHIEPAGTHSGDSMGVLPPQRLKLETADKIEAMSRALAEEMSVLGHFNLQLAVQDDEVYILEANPRSSRSVPFISKATKVPLVDLAIEAVLGKTKGELTTSTKEWRSGERVCVKGVVFPFNKFKDSDSILGPEMKSTGESMGIGADYSEALLKAFVSSSISLPLQGEVFLSLREKDKSEILPLVRELVEMGYSLSGTSGTATFLEQSGLSCLAVKKVHEGRPNCVDRIRSGEVALVINTTSGRRSIEASFGIRRSCIDYAVPCVTESHTVAALVLALRKLRSQQIEVAAL